jgi:uncharacterized membrane protein YGL010W
VKSLAEQISAYAAYHRDSRNTLTHFVGVPLVTFGIFLFLSWFRFRFTPEDIPITAATLFYVSVLIYYLRLDWSIAILQLPVSLALLWLADRAALLSLTESVMVFLGAFVGGWVIQLLGHYLEGKRPALLDNLTQIFNAPLFLTAEVLFLFGLRQDLRKAPVRAAHVSGRPQVEEKVPS